MALLEGLQPDTRCAMQSFIAAAQGEFQSRARLRLAAAKCDPSPCNPNTLPFAHSKQSAKIPTPPNLILAVLQGATHPPPGNLAKQPQLTLVLMTGNPKSTLLPLTSYRPRRACKSAPASLLPAVPNHTQPDSHLPYTPCHDLNNP